MSVTPYALMMTDPTSEVMICWIDERPEADDTPQSLIYGPNNGVAVSTVQPLTESAFHHRVHLTGLAAGSLCNLAVPSIGVSFPPVKMLPSRIPTSGLVGMQVSDMHCGRRQINTPAVFAFIGAERPDFVLMAGDSSGEFNDSFSASNVEVHIATFRDYLSQWWADGDWLPQMLADAGNHWVGRHTSSGETATTADNDDTKVYDWFHPNAKLLPPVGKRHMALKVGDWLQVFSADVYSNRVSNAAPEFRAAHDPDAALCIFMCHSPFFSQGDRSSNDQLLQRRLREALFHDLWSRENCRFTFGGNIHLDTITTPLGYFAASPGGPTLALAGSVAGFIAPTSDWRGVVEFGEGCIGGRSLQADPIVPTEFWDRLEQHSLNYYLMRFLPDRVVVENKNESGLAETRVFPLPSTRYSNGRLSRPRARDGSPAYPLSSGRSAAYSPPPGGSDPSPPEDSEPPPPVEYDPAPTQMLSSISVTEPLKYPWRDPNTDEVVATEVTVTWTFNQPAECGQYCNGDWFVKSAPGLEVVSVDPPSRRVADLDDTHSRFSSTFDLVGRWIHGLMIDPQDWERQGFDSFTYDNRTTTYAGETSRDCVPVAPGRDSNSRWTPILNRDPAFIPNADAGITSGEVSDNPRGPIPLDRRMTLVKNICRARPGTLSRTGQEFYVPLTVVEEIPPAGAFRPPVPGPAAMFTPPVTWTEAAVQSALENLPRLNFSQRTLRTPTSHPEYWAKMQRDAKRCWLSWSAQSTHFRGLAPVWMADAGGSPYRREVGEYITRMMEALVADCPWEDKRDIFIGLIQLGIDQAANNHLVNGPAFTIPPQRKAWDVGRGAPTALALALLPDTGWLQQAWDAIDQMDDKRYATKGSLFEEVRTHKIITQLDENDPPVAHIPPTDQVWDWIDPNPDQWPPGPVEGMVGHGTWVGRTGYLEGFSLDNPEEGYMGINTRATAGSIICLWHIEGGYEAFGSNGFVRWLDRLYMTDPRPLPRLPSLGRWWREVRDLPVLESFAVKTPNRLFKRPVVEGFGTSLIVQVPPHEGDNGSPITGLDIRYRPIALDRRDRDNWVISETTLSEGWEVIEDIQGDVDANGIYILDAGDPFGGLLPETYYAVQVRYKNALGPAGWSRTHGTWAGHNNSNLLSRVMFSRYSFAQTGVAIAPAYPQWVTPPEMESFFATNAKARVNITNPPEEGANYTGFPFPSRSFQWRLDGVNIPDATTQEIDIPSDAAGKVLSCVVTLTNSQGTDSITVVGQEITAAPPLLGYQPSLMQTSGNVRFTGSPGFNIFPPNVHIKKGTISFIFGGRVSASAEIMGGSSAGFVNVNSTGRVTIQISRGTTPTRGYAEFVGPSPQAAHWYMIAIDTDEPEEIDRVKMWVRPADSTYPPKRIMPDYIGATYSGGTFNDGDTWRFSNGSSTGERLFPEDPETQSFIIGDVYLEQNAARGPSHFIAPNGEFIDPAQNGGNPFILMGSNMTAQDWADGINLGTGAPATSPLPVGGSGEFEAIGDE